MVGVGWNIGVFVMCRFLGVSGVVKRVTIVGTIVRGSQGYVLFAIKQAMLRLSVHREHMGWCWIQHL